MAVRKVLILSLGTGRKVEGDYPYRTTGYRMGEDGKIIKSPFVAEALMEYTQPEQMIIVGTVKSAWDAFYHRYHRESADFQRKWESIERKIAAMDKDSSDEEMLEFQCELNKLYAEELEIGGQPRIQVCLIRYGLTEEELKNSYRRISRCLRDALGSYGEEEEIEISFDITHSFRSIPIYNLVVIDYCRLLTAKNIHISHVFYGNLDVARENGDVAQIVDLKDIVDILETTRGINEFHNTGNARSFLQWYASTGQEEDTFIKLLRRFNGAMQMNNRSELLSALEQLLDLELQGDSNALLDAKVTIKEKLERELVGPGGSGADAVEIQINKAWFQISLAEWCLKHGQVGLASAIGKEGFRSYLVAVYEEDFGKYEEEGARRRGEQLFGNRCKEQPLNPLFEQYQRMEPKAKEIRNVYAHNLESPAEKNITYQEAEETIRSYISTIKGIMQLERQELELTDSAESFSVAGKKITLFLTNQQASWKDTMTLTEPTTMLLQLKCGQVRGAKKKEAVKYISRIIALKVEELCNRYGEDILAKVVWGRDMEELLVQNASVLMKHVARGSNISFLKLNGEKQEQVKVECLWKIDLSEELSEKLRGDMSDKLRGYRFEKLST